MDKSTLLGGKNFGLTGGADLTIGNIHTLMGLHNGQKGLGVGATLMGLSGSPGGNFVGENVNISGSAGLQFNLGYELSADSCHVDMGFFSTGFSYGPTS